MEEEKLINEQLEKSADALAERLSHVQIYEKDNIKGILSIYFRQAMIDCVRVQMSKTESERYELASSVQLLGGRQRALRQEGLVKINAHLKKQRRLYGELDKPRFIDELIKWMKENHNESFLEFKDQYKEKFPQQLVCN